MSVLEAIAIFAAGIVARNNNTVGRVPGNASGALGYRRELTGQRRRAIPLMCMSLIGSGIGATLLLTLPASAFKAIVPVFIGAALVLIVLQPRISRWLATRGGGASENAGPL